MRKPRFGRLGLCASLTAAAALVAACAGTGAGGSSGGGSGEQITLRYAFFAPEQTFPAVQMKEWKKRLEKRTDGLVKVELYPGGTLLESGDIFDGVSRGVADVGMDSPAYDVGRFPLASAVTLPVEFPNSQVASRTMLDLLLEFKPKAFAEYEVITAFTTEPAYLQTIKPVRSRADLSGMQLRSAGAGVPALKALGASPVGMSMPDVAQALQTDVINGYMSSREVLKDFGLAEQVNHVTDYPFGISNTFVAVMDKEKFNELPQKVQKVIRDLRPKMTKFASEYHDKQNVGGAIEWAKKKHGLEVVQLENGERKAWDKQLSKLVDNWSSKVDGQGFDPQQVLDRMYELRDKYAAEQK